MQTTTMYLLDNVATNTKKRKQKVYLSEKDLLVTEELESHAVEEEEELPFVEELLEFKDAQVLVRWVGYEEPTWESVAAIAM